MIAISFIIAMHMEFLTPQAEAAVVIDDYCECCVNDAVCEFALLWCSTGYVATGATECCQEATTCAGN